MTELKGCDNKLIDNVDEPAGWRVCPCCEGECQMFAWGEWEECRVCEGQGGVCDRCGEPPEHRISENETSGGCWCHY